MDKIRIVSIKTIANNFIKKQIKILEKNKKQQLIKGGTL